MADNVCLHCGSALTLARLVQVKGDGEYACESCAVAEREGLDV